MSKQSKQSNKKNISSPEEMSLEKSKQLTEEIETEDVSDSEPESSSESESEDPLDQLESDEEEESKSEDEMLKALNEAQAKKEREIKGFNALTEKVWYEIRYISQENKSPNNTENKVRVMNIQDRKRKNLPFFVYAPASVNPNTVWEYLVGNGAYIQPLGKVKSLATGHNYNNCKVKTLPKKRTAAPFDQNEAADFEIKIEKALKSLRKEKSAVSNRIKEQQRLIAELKAKKLAAIDEPQKKKKTKKSAK